MRSSILALFLAVIFLVVRGETEYEGLEEMLNTLSQLGAVKDAITADARARKLHSNLWLDSGIQMDDGALDHFAGNYETQQHDSHFRKRSVQGWNDDYLTLEIRGQVTSGLLDELKTLGCNILFSSERFSSITAEIPASRLLEVAAHDNIKSITPLPKRTIHAATDPEGILSHRVNVVFENFPGIDGSGIKVGVISDSVDNLMQVQNAGDLGGVKVLEGQEGYGIGEGTAMLQVIYNVAPNADLHFATAGDTQASFSQNIVDLVSAGCKVIVDAASLSDEPIFQDGLIAQSINGVASQGVAYFSAAGNGGNFRSGASQTWEGNYVATNYTNGNPLLPNGYPDIHTFGSNPYILVTNPKSVQLYWADNYEYPSTDFDLFAFFTNGTLAASSMGANYAHEFISLPDDATYKIIVARKSGSSARYISFNSEKGSFTPSTKGRINGHAATAGAITIAATHAYNDSSTFYTVPKANILIETFSSDGPRKLFYYPNGTVVTPGNFLESGGMSRMKPDFTAASGVTTTSPGFLTFSGTSCAAAHAAAIGVLILSYNPTLNRDQVYEALQMTAIDILDPGRDDTSGYGVLDAPNILNYLKAHYFYDHPTTAAPVATQSSAGVSVLPVSMFILLITSFCVVKFRFF